VAASRITPAVVFAPWLYRYPFLQPHWSIASRYCIPLIDFGREPEPALSAVKMRELAFRIDR
jgi:hypothetical protein